MSVTPKTVMNSKIKTSLLATSLVACTLVMACPGSSWAQTTVDEITELKRRQMLQELKKDEKPALVPINPGGLGAMQGMQGLQGQMANKPGQEVPEFAVISIFGANDKALTAVVQENPMQTGRAHRPIRLKQGSVTPSGWIVERINATSVEFKRALPASKKVTHAPSKVKKAQASAVEDEIKYQRVVVGVGAVQPSNPYPMNSGLQSYSPPSGPLQGNPVVVPAPLSSAIPPVPTAALSAALPAASSTGGN
jgi:hypothetical protein